MCVRGKEEGAEKRGAIDFGWKSESYGELNWYSVFGHRPGGRKEDSLFWCSLRLKVVGLESRGLLAG